MGLGVGLAGGAPVSVGAADGVADSGASGSAGLTAENRGGEVVAAQPASAITADRTVAALQGMVSSPSKWADGRRPTPWHRRHVNPARDGLLTNIRYWQRVRAAA